MDKLSIFVQDTGYRGGIVVIAETEEEARIMMNAKSHNYDKFFPVEKLPIKAGFVFEFMGDS